MIEGYFVGKVSCYGDTAGRVQLKKRITLFVFLSLCLCIAGANAQIVKVNFQPAAAPVLQSSSGYE